MAGVLLDKWQQPTWFCNSNSHGTVTASGYNGVANEAPFRVFDGNTGYPHYATGTAVSTSSPGWINLKLNYRIKVFAIYFYNLAASQGVGDGYFTGDNGVALGGAFTDNSLASCALTVINVPNGVITSTVRLNVTRKNGANWGASQIKIVGDKVDTPPMVQSWVQPTWSGYINTHGTVTASGYNGQANEAPWRAFDGAAAYPHYATGTAVSTTNPGWIELKLKYRIRVYGIFFYNLAASQGVGDGYFTGDNGVSLGSSFTDNSLVSSALTVIDVPGVITSTIKLNVTRKNGANWGASQIKIVGEMYDSMPLPTQIWTQPAWTSNSNPAGTISTSSSPSNANEKEWRAFDGNIGTPHFATGSAVSTTNPGTLTLQLNSNIRVYKILFYNLAATQGTRNAYFTGSNGALGSPFTADGSTYLALTVINVGGVVTNKIQLNVTSKNDAAGAAWGASQIIILAEAA